MQNRKNENEDWKVGFQFSQYMGPILKYYKKTHIEKSCSTLESEGDIHEKTHFI